MVELFSAENIERVLCVVAHPDDMEYGASAAVAEWTAQGVEVAYLLLTAGEAGIRGMHPTEVGPLRAKEQRRACDIVGVSDLTILDFPDGLLEPTPSTRAHIARHIRRVRPQVIMTTTWELEVPWGLNHVDHRVAGLAVVDAIRDADNPWIYPEQFTGGIEPWSATWLVVSGTAPTHVVELSEDSVQKGIASLDAHELYLGALPGHPSGEDIVGGAARGGAELAREAGFDIEYGLGVRAIQMG